MNRRQGADRTSDAVSRRIVDRERLIDELQRHRREANACSPEDRLRRDVVERLPQALGIQEQNQGRDCSDLIAPDDGDFVWFTEPSDPLDQSPRLT